jgi:hypothetical protein
MTEGVHAISHVLSLKYAIMGVSEMLLSSTCVDVMSIILQYRSIILINEQVITIFQLWPSSQKRASHQNIEFYRRKMDIYPKIDCFQ